MSADYANQDPLSIAKQAERDLNTQQAKGNAKGGVSDSAGESGVNESVEAKFPGASVTVGSAASGKGDNREIPLEEGGGINPRTGQPTKARDFEGEGGLEEKERIAADVRGGDDDVRGVVEKSA